MKQLSIHMAPLQGYTEAAYRNAHAASFGGIAHYYTPFVRIEKDAFRAKDLRDIDPANNEVPHLVPQLIASTPEKAERMLHLFTEKGYKEADINLGCPFPLLAKRHQGSGILPYPDEVKNLLSIVNKFPQISISVKMRLGWEAPDECLHLAPILNALPLSQITLHPRLGKQQYKGSVDLKGFAAFYDVCQHPLVFNGDLLSVDDIRNIQERFPRLSGVMIGRGLLAHPELAWEYCQNTTLSSEEKKAKLQAMHSYVFRHYAERLEGGEAQLLSKMKTFWEYLLPDADKKQLKAIHKSSNLTKYEQAVAAFFLS